MTFPFTWTVRRDGSHYNAKDWFGEGGRCDQEPRLSYIDRCYRATKQVRRSWFVDGAECANSDEAWAKLQNPPTFTEAEFAALAVMTDEPQDLRGAYPFEVLRGLRHKGAVSAHMGRYAITPAGRAVLATSTKES